MSPRVISKYTLGMIALMVGATAATAALVSAALKGAFGDSGEVLTLWFADIGTIAVTALAAVVILRTAFTFRPGEPFRRYWMLIGIGTALYSLGDTTWAFFELRGLDVPYPGLPDVFYLSEYVFLAAGLFIAAWGYHRLLPWKVPAVIAAVASLGAAALMWFGLLNPFVVSDPEIPVAEKVISAAYPLFDVFFALAPAIFLLLMVYKLAGGRLAWPWWAVAVGALLLAVSDSGYSWMQAAGTYATGGVLDYGWMLAHAALATGALIVRDIARG